MKIVLLFFFLMSGILSMSKRSQPAGADDLTSSTNQSQWSQDHRICMNYKCYYNTYVPSYLLQMVQTASVSMTMRIVCVVVEGRIRVMETVVQNTKENSGAIFTNSVGVATRCPVDKNLGLTGHGKPVPKSERDRKCA